MSAGAHPRAGPPAMILGLDPGERRTGVAVADDETRFARPLEVIDARITNPVTRVVELVQELGVTCIVVGKPLSLSGTSGPAVATRGKFVDALRAATPVPIIDYDERLSSVQAERQLRSAGARHDKRKAALDAVAAQIILQSYLDSTP